MSCTDQDDLCCHCEAELPESVFDWVVGYGHVFCSDACATGWEESL